MTNYMLYQHIKDKVKGLRIRFKIPFNLKIDSRQHKQLVAHDPRYSY